MEDGRIDLGGLVRTETRLSDSAAKDLQEEDFLRRLNDLLADAHEQEYLHDLPETHATLHVVGVPRSGTTLATQLLTSCLDVGSINNLSAAFWRAPLYGIRLSKKLLGVGYDSRFASEHGRTSGISEPHEFGYFWSSLLGMSELAEPGPDAESVDWERVRLVLTNMSHEFGRPMVFKSFHLMFRLRELTRAMPRTCVVRIRRDPVETALSLWKLRRSYAAEESEWVGIAPREREWLQDQPVPVQLAGQVHFLEQRLDEQMASGDLNSLTVDLRELCRHPSGTVAAVRRLVEEVAPAVGQTAEPPPSFEYPANTPPPEDIHAIRSAFDKLDHLKGFHP